MNEQKLRGDAAQNDKVLNEERLRGEAARCRRLAQAVNDPHAVSTLTGMAEKYEAEARALPTLR